ncbi:unnamed protein product [Brassica oleracea var. botrytis]
MDIENLSTILEHQTEQEQSSRLGSKEPKISYVYSSDLKSVFETAQIIAAKCGTLEVSNVCKLLCRLLTDPDLRERHLGDMQGLVYQEASKAFSSNRTDVDIPKLTYHMDEPCYFFLVIYGDWCLVLCSWFYRCYFGQHDKTMLIGADPSHVDDRCIE